jgi:hypothetical protein
VYSEGSTLFMQCIWKRESQIAGNSLLSIQLVFQELFDLIFFVSLLEYQ